MLPATGRSPVPGGALAATLCTPPLLPQKLKNERLMQQQSGAHLAAAAAAPAPGPTAVYMYPPMRERYCGPISWVVGAPLLGKRCCVCVCRGACPPARELRLWHQCRPTGAHVAPPVHTPAAGICLLPCIFLCPVDERDVYPMGQQPVAVVAHMQPPAVAVAACHGQPGHGPMTRPGEPQPVDRWSWLTGQKPQG